VRGGAARCPISTPPARQRLDPSPLDGRTRRQPQAHAVDRGGNGPGEGPEDAEGGRGPVKIVVGDHLHDVDFVQVREDGGGQFPPPSEPDSVPPRGDVA